MMLVTTRSFGQNSPKRFDDPTKNGLAANRFTVPAGVTSITIQAWGGGAGGKDGGNGGGGSGCGGGGFTEGTFVVIPGSTYDLIVGVGGAANNNGGNTSFGSISLVSSGGIYGGSGGTSNTGTITFSGGSAGINLSPSIKDGAGGGSAAGSNANGNGGGDAKKESIGAGGLAILGGGAGGAGAMDGEAGSDGRFPGGGGGKQDVGGKGGNGLVIISYCKSSAGTLSGTQGICVLGVTTFSSTTSGGTWSSGSTGITRVNAFTGVVTGVAGGTATITYTVTGAVGCADVVATRTVTVNSIPATPTVDKTTQPDCITPTGSVVLTNYHQETGLLILVH